LGGEDVKAAENIFVFLAAVLTTFIYLYVFARCFELPYFSNKIEA